MALAPKPITVEYVAPGDYTGAFSPKPYAIIGEAPTAIDPQTAPTIDDTPTDAAAVATDLQTVVDALIAAGVFTAP